MTGPHVQCHFPDGGVFCAAMVMMLGGEEDSAES